MDCFDRVDLVSEFEVFDFRCGPKSSLVVVVVADERPVDFLRCPPIFSNAFKFLWVRRARLRGLLVLVSINVSSPRFRV